LVCTHFRCFVTSLLNHPAPFNSPILQLHIVRFPKIVYQISLSTLMILPERWPGYGLFIQLASYWIPHDEGWLINCSSIPHTCCISRCFIWWGRTNALTNLSLATVMYSVGRLHSAI
jgi:hypothetical protein